MEFVEFQFTFLILKISVSVLVFLLLLKMLIKYRKRKDSNLQILMFLFLFYWIAIITSLIGTFFLFLPYSGSSYDENIKFMINLVAWAFGSILFLYFSFNAYNPEDSLSSFKKLIVYIALLILIVISILFAIFFYFALPTETLHWIIGFTMLVCYIFSIYGWLKIRINISDESMEDKDEYEAFMKRFNLTGLGGLLHITGFTFIFTDIMILINSPVKNTIFSFIGWIITMLGMYCFYKIFQTKKEN
jgi:uncharacterized membrane protein YfcA